MKNSEIKKMMTYLCHAQIAFLRSFPVRENIGSYCEELDIEKNVDFAIWELEMME